MKYLFILVLFLSACGTFKGEKGDSCTVKEYENGYYKE
jgi:hypothetical protein